MAFIHSPKIITDGLVLALDAANSKSYVSGSTNWFNLANRSISGSLINGPTFDSGSGGSIVFDGVDDFIDCGNNSTLTLSTQGTISAWIKTNRSYPSNTASNTFRGIVGKVNTGGLGQQSYWMDWYGTNASRILRLGIGDATGSTQLEIGNFDFANSWTYVLGTWNGSTAQIYVNGVIRGSISNTTVAQTLVNPAKVGYVFQSWEGNITSAQIYNRFFSPTEILQNYNTTKGRFGL